MPKTGFFKNAELPLETLEAGKVSRKIRAYAEPLMAVEVFMEEGAEGYEHTHPHTQICYCLEGEFLFSLNGQAETITAGDSVFIPGGVKHGAKCLKKGRVLDVFTPEREDFLQINA